MQLLLVIPAVNESENLDRLLPFLRSELNPGDQIVVSDGGSTDDTVNVCRRHGVVHFSSPRRGRGPQMNAAVLAHGPAEAYYFVHADSRPPRGFATDIRREIEAGNPVGCYRFRFDSRHPLLRINSFCTRFNALPCRGGDQSLYVSQAAWTELGGFHPDMLIMEDYDFIERAQEEFPFRIIPRDILVSARKYHANNYFKVQLANLRVFRMYRRGASQREMKEFYERVLG